jgi:long-subunit fatty acid transport protein
MRKLLFFIVSLFITGSLLAGGLVTNNNQSAMFTRLQNRNASTGIDAVYFNPAGVSRLGEGFFVSINNQTITQTQKVLSNYEFLTGQPKEYIGDVKAPVFPGVYLVYNTGKLSFSAGFNPIGGGGGAEYKTGLPSFETMVANIPPSLSSQGIPTTGYSADIFFKGSSVYFGYQVNVGYKVTEKLSVALGARFVSAKNTYEGYLKNISINPTYPAFGATGSMIPATQFFSTGATTLNTLAAGATSFVTGLQPLITGGAGSVLLSNGTSVGLTATQVGQIQQIIGAAGQNPAGLTIAQAQGILSASAPVFTQKAAAMSANAAGTQDMNVNASQAGTGITPIISVNFAPSEMINLSARYEFKTKLDMKTTVVNNEGGGIFVDGVTVVGDMPAALSLGAVVRPINKLMLTASFNEYFDKNIDYDGSKTIDIDMIDKNFLEFGLGAEYGLTDKLRISAGWSHTSTGVNQNYQGDQSFSTNTNSIGTGIGYRFSPMIDFNLGYQRAFYASDTKNFDTKLPGGRGYYETYNKSTWMIAAGLDFYFGKK